MRAFLDANIFISYLLNPTAKTPPAIVVRRGLAGHYTMLVSQTVFGEVRRKIAAKRWLASRISVDDTEAFLSLLAEVADVVSELSEPFPAVGNDRNDDYLFAHALLSAADYLVSGDDGVLRVGQIEDVRVVSPSRFLAILEQTSRL